LSQAGHHQSVEILGDIIKVLRHPAGPVRAIIVQVTLEERLELAIVSSRWPDDIREGMRIFAKGHLATESTSFRRATHFLVPRYIEVVSKRREVSSATQAGARTGAHVYP
jgi:6,7-dimethyl-8-ribityllumazine synthase